MALQARFSSGMEHHCWQCGTPGADARCAGCKDAPLIDGSTFMGPRYCDKECQVAHWRFHKIECKIHQNTKQQLALRRAVDLLGSLFLIWREACYDRPIIDVAACHTGVKVYEDYDKAATLIPGGRIYPFDASLVHDEDTKRQILCNMVCDTFVAFLHELNVLFLKGLVKDWEEVEIQVKGVLKPICIYDSVRGKSGLHASHHLLKVQLKSGSFWAVDITAAQYGWKEILLPWSDYCSKRCQNIIAINKMGERREAFMMNVIGDPDFGDKQYRKMAIWTRVMGDVFRAVVGDHAEHLGINIVALITSSEARWTSLQSALLLSVSQTWQAEAKEADSVYAEGRSDMMVTERASKRWQITVDY